MPGLRKNIHTADDLQVARVQAGTQVASERLHVVDARCRNTHTERAVDPRVVELDDELAVREAEVRGHWDGVLRRESDRLKDCVPRLRDERSQRALTRQLLQSILRVFTRCPITQQMDAVDGLDARQVGRPEPLMEQASELAHALDPARRQPDAGQVGDPLVVQVHHNMAIWVPIEFLEDGIAVVQVKLHVVNCA
eukprot:4264975-Prymnesium_polylepis.2